LVKKIEDRLNNQNSALIKCKDYEVVKGDKESSLWIVEVDDSVKIAVDAEDYLKLLSTIEKLVKLNFEYELEKHVIESGAKDVDDIKAIVKEELKKDKTKSISDILNRLKTENRTLFYNLDELGDILENY